MIKISSDLEALKRLESQFHYCSSCGAVSALPATLLLAVVVQLLSDAKCTHQLFIRVLEKLMAELIDTKWRSNYKGYDDKPFKILRQ